MARTLDTVPTFDAFARKAALKTPIERETMWRERYEAPHREVFDAFYDGYGSQNGRAALVRELSKVKNRVAEAAPVVRSAVEELDAALAKALDLPAEPSPLHVLMVGTFSTNAAVTPLGDDIAVLHCLEWFQTPEGARVLVAHETTHAWHRLAPGLSGRERAIAEPNPPETDAGWLAFSEGVAIQASREVAPGAAETDYFWYGHPDVEDWLPWCRENRDGILERFANGFDESWTFEAFFGAGTVDERWRVGYFVADEVVKALGKPLPELIRMGPDEGKAAVRSVLLPG